jgi:sugar (pentulose or hexulose) kinase
MSEVVIGIDVGTSGLRAALCARDLSILAMAQRAMPIPIQMGGRLMQDPQLWATALNDVLSDLKPQIEVNHVRAIAVDGTSGTILPVDKDGRPLGLASMYNDVAEESDLARVAKVASADSAALGAVSPLARAIPMAKTEGVARILHQADWIAGLLCGRFEVSDENNALKTGYDPRARRWPGWIRDAGMDPALLPDVVPAGEKTGPISHDAAKRFGLPQDVAIVAGTTDGCAAFLASGAADAGDGVSSLGTTLTIKLLSETPVFAPQYGIYSHRIGDNWLAGGASNTGGAAIASQLSREEIARLTPLLKPDEPTGLDYYPLPKSGERFPVNDPKYSPRFEPKPDDARVFFQAILEGIANIEALAYRRLTELGASPLKTLRTVGGGAANEGWTRIRQDKLGVTFLPAASEHAAVGAAVLAWRGIA